VSGLCTTPETATKILAVLAGATVMVKAVVEALPENKSVTNAALVGSFPMYAIMLCMFQM
jgi:hypothetical protein